MSKYKYNDGDIVGNNFLLVKRGPLSNNRKTCISEFKCPWCNKIFKADLYNIVRKDSSYKSCGCKKIDEKTGLSSFIKDLTGKRFGRLTVTGISDKRVPHPNGGSFIYWNCRCDCGKETVISTSKLSCGHTTSCGKCCISKGEDKIKKALEDCNIKFEQQKRFKDCRDKNPLPFDFYLPDYNCCIEFDGKQHFHIPNNEKSTIFTEDKIKEIQKHDKIKDLYCLNNNIKLIRISYIDLDNIDADFLKEKLNENT